LGPIRPIALDNPEDLLTKKLPPGGRACPAAFPPPQSSLFLDWQPFACESVTDVEGGAIPAIPSKKKASFASAFVSTVAARRHGTEDDEVAPSKMKASP
jgi:hypothetical protein